MPFVLSDRKVCHPYVPLAWKPVLEDLAEFLTLERQLRQQPKDNELIQTIQCVHDRLISGSNELLEPQAIDDLSDHAAHRMFARSMFLTMRIATSVSGDDSVLDTANCRTLRLYEADYMADPEHQHHLIDALRKTVCLSDDELAIEETSVETDVRQAERKHRVVRAIRDQFGLWEDSENLRANVFRFFDAIYPNVGILPEEVELIVTGTMIFFCLPFSKDKLTNERFRKLSPHQQQPISDFLQRVNRFSQWQFAHFPVFGFRRGADLDGDLLEQLAARCQLSADDVANELSTLTAVIPIAELDKYVVHDIWGHSWQACMLGFDDLYEKLATYADSLQLDEFAVGPNNDNTLTFTDCFVGDGDALCLDEAAFRRFVDLEVAERLPVAMTPVLAEVLADVAEFKLLDTERTSDMASSSALKKFPAKLDLTMRDVVYYFRQATKVFRLWASRSDRLQRTVDQLVERGAAKDAAKLAVRQAAQVWRELEQDWFSAEPHFYIEDGKLHANVVCRLALNFLAVHRETLTVYRRVGAMELGNLPLKGLRDLMLISIAVFFEDAPSTNLWRVDEFLSLKMEPLCEAFVANSKM